MLRALFFALALLAAQQSALAHAVWHADPAQTQGDDEARLCDLHTALGTLLGVLDGAPKAAAPAVSVECAPVFAARRPGPLPTPVPSSRGPPALLK